MKWLFWLASPLSIDSVGKKKFQNPSRITGVMMFHVRHIKSGYLQNICYAVFDIFNQKQPQRYLCQAQGSPSKFEGPPYEPKGPP